MKLQQASRIQFLTNEGIRGWLGCLLILIFLCSACRKSEEQIRAEKMANNETLRKAAASGDVNSVRELLAKGAEVNSTDANGVAALMKAAAYGNVDTVRELIKAGADVNAADQKGESVLMYGVNDTAPHSGSFSVNRTATVRDLLIAGADVHYKNRAGDTALTKAAAWGNVNGVQELIKAGSDLEATNGSGMTALMCAANQPKSINNTTEIVKLLVEAGADVKTRSTEGMTALNYAERHASNPAVTQILQEAGEERVPLQAEESEEAPSKEANPLGELFSAPSQVLKQLQDMDEMKNLEKMIKKRNLPPSDLEKLKHTCSLSYKRTEVSCTINNGSSWIIEEVVVEFRGTTKKGVSLVRQYTFVPDPPLQPAGSFTDNQDSGFDVDFDVASFTLFSASGKKQEKKAANAAET